MVVSGGEEHYCEALRSLGVSVIALPPRGGPVGRMGDMTRAVCAMRPDVVQSVHAHMNLRALVAARLCQVQAIGALRTDPGRSVAAIGKLGPASLRWPDTLLGNSRRHLDTAVRDFGVRRGRCVHLPNCVDLPDLRDRRPDDGGLRVLFVGRLVDVKRPADFVAAVSLLHRSGHAVTAAMVGDGQLSASVKRAVHGYGLQDVVELPGELDDPSAEFARADVLVCPSANEGVPNVVLEAMSWGLPVIATDVGGVSEVVQDGRTGLLVPPRSPDAVATAIEKIFDAELAHRLGSAGRSTVELHHSASAVGSRLARILRSHASTAPRRQI